MLEVRQNSVDRTTRKPGGPSTGPPPALLRPCVLLRPRDDSLFGHLARPLPDPDRPMLDGSKVRLVEGTWEWITQRLG
jgi:hypothetical protein